MNWLALIAVVILMIVCFQCGETQGWGEGFDAGVRSAHQTYYGY